eukprot:1473056-Pyramimonas_sp.AAC.1
MRFRSCRHSTLAQPPQPRLFDFDPNKPKIDRLAQVSPVAYVAACAHQRLPLPPPLPAPLRLLVVSPHSSHNATDLSPIPGLSTSLVKRVDITITCNYTYYRPC